MAKTRTPVPEDIAARVLYLHDHTCCVCQVRGRLVQIHHLDEDPSNHDPDDLAVLCLECHNQTQIKGGFAKKLREVEIREYRDSWLNRVAQRRERADEIATAKQVGITNNLALVLNSVTLENWHPPSKITLRSYIDSAPSILSTAYAAAKSDLESGFTLVELQAVYSITDVVEQIFLHLASAFSSPPGMIRRSMLTCRVRRSAAWIAGSSPAMTVTHTKSAQDAAQVHPTNRVRPPASGHAMLHP